MWKEVWEIIEEVEFQKMLKSVLNLPIMYKNKLNFLLFDDFLWKKDFVSFTQNTKKHWQEKRSEKVCFFAFPKIKNRTWFDLVCNLKLGWNS